MKIGYNGYNGYKVPQTRINTGFFCTRFEKWNGYTGYKKWVHDGGNMKKDYLSVTESGNIILMGCALSAIEEYISGKAYATKDEITQLKHTKTRMLKYIDLVGSRLSQKALKTMLNKTDTYSAVAVPKKSTDYHKVTLIDDDFDDLIELFIDSYCNGCTGKKDCLGRNVMRKALVPPLDAGHPVCEYCRLDRN